MSVFYNGKVISGPGNSAYIGANGNWWVGDNDQNIPASPENNVHFVTQEELDTTNEIGLYIVTDPNNLGIWFVDNKNNKLSINGATPHIGSNGNWYIGSIDTGVHSTAVCETIPITFRAAAWRSVTVGDLTTYRQEVPVDVDIEDHCTIDFNYGRDMTSELTPEEIEKFTIEQYNINLVDSINIVNGRVIAECYREVPTGDCSIKLIKHITSQNPVEISDIDDKVTNVNKTWSSTKIQGIIDELKRGVIEGKSLEFKWNGTSLGVRQTGYEEYHYKDLQGPEGKDGASLVNGYVDAAGDLILEIPENNILNEYTGVSVIKEKGSLSNVSEFHNVFGFTGSGYISFGISGFVGKIIIRIDGIEYSKDVNSKNNNGLGFNSLIDDIFLKEDDHVEDLKIYFRENIDVLIRVDSEEPIFVVNGICFSENE